jgi:hypothetical protein
MIFYNQEREVTMLRKILDKIVAKLKWLIVIASVLYTVYLVSVKLASEPTAGNINGLQMAPWVTLMAVTINLCFYWVAGCFDRDRLKKQWPIFLASGCATGPIIITGVITLALKAVKITEAASLTKATAIPASLLATFLLIRSERKRLLQDKYQMVGGVLALCAISVNLKGIVSRMGNMPMFVFVLTGIYALSSFIRTPLMRKTPGDGLGYGAGDQLFASLFVYGFSAFLRWGNFSILPHELELPFNQMRIGLMNPSFKMMAWAFPSALAFGLYAPACILLLKYKENGSTAVLGNIMQKLVGVIGAVLALPVMNLCAWLFFDRNAKIAWYDESEVIGLLLFASATITSLFPQIRSFLKSKSENHNASSRGQNTTRSGGLQPSPV